MRGTSFGVAIRGGESDGAPALHVLVADIDAVRIFGAQFRECGFAARAQA